MSHSDLHSRSQSDTSLSGKLTVTIFRGLELRDSSLIGQQDVYCLVRLGAQQLRSTTAKHGGIAPFWNDETHSLDLVDFSSHDDVTVEVWSVGVMSDELLGKFSAPLFRLLVNPGPQLNALIFNDTKKGGFIELGFDFKPRVESAALGPIMHARTASLERHMSSDRLLTQHGFPTPYTVTATDAVAVPVAVDPAVPQHRHHRSGSLSNIHCPHSNVPHPVPLMFRPVKITDDEESADLGTLAMKHINESSPAYVALRAYGGPYLTCLDDGRLVAQGESLGQPQVFVFTPLEQKSTFALKSVYRDKFVTAHADGRISVAANNSGLCEDFAVAHKDDGTFTFETPAHRFLSARPDGSVAADQEVPKETEHFAAIPLQLSEPAHAFRSFPSANSEVNAARPSHVVDYYVRRASVPNTGEMADVAAAAVAAFAASQKTDGNEEH